MGGSESSNKTECESHCGRAAVMSNNNFKK